MTPEELAARYPLRKMEDAPRDGTSIIVYAAPFHRAFVMRHEEELGWHNHAGTFPWVDDTALGWLPVPEYDYEARIADLEAELARTEYEALRDAERVAWVFLHGKARCLCIEEDELDRPKRNRWWLVRFCQSDRNRSDNWPAGNGDFPTLTPEARAIIDAAKEATQ